ncbi:hypothetical protein K470DRAFT_258555 [Piedraia hortae CBS 480.64]|uniref:Uncharacterized protein n=1 Tax=Piedraia hortae CBS 480.64 TaxID=1314780 RepID=A0A6A7BYC2_9PEZI|nr:hypothetical protein K470DRAFT_258555 [Piedraia hortae CBS 480.64]
MDYSPPTSTRLRLSSTASKSKQHEQKESDVWNGYQSDEETVSRTGLEDDDSLEDILNDYSSISSLDRSPSPPPLAQAVQIHNGEGRRQVAQAITIVTGKAKVISVSKPSTPVSPVSMELPPSPPPPCLPPKIEGGLTPSFPPKAFTRQRLRPLSMTPSLAAAAANLNRALPKTPTTSSSSSSTATPGTKASSPTTIPSPTSTSGDSGSRFRLHKFSSSLTNVFGKNKDSMRSPRSVPSLQRVKPGDRPISSLGLPPDPNTIGLGSETPRTAKPQTKKLVPRGASERAPAIELPPCPEDYNPDGDELMVPVPLGQMHAASVSQTALSIGKKRGITNMGRRLSYATTLG